MLSAASSLAEPSPGRITESRGAGADYGRKLTPPGPLTSNKQTNKDRLVPGDQMSQASSTETSPEPSLCWSQAEFNIESSRAELRA